MTWIDSCPSVSAPLPCSETPISIIDIPHSPLLGVLSQTHIILLNKSTLIPVAIHKRTQDSVNEQGANTGIHTKHISVNSSQLQKLPVLNLFVETDKSYLLIFQIIIDNSTSTFEIDDDSNNTLQKGKPLGFTSQKFTLGSLLQSLTKNIIGGNSKVHLDLENIEHFNNSTIDDQVDNFEIGHVKLSICRVLKIANGITNLWLKQNSHNLFIYKHSEATQEKDEDSLFQVINIKSSNSSEIFKLSNLEWYGSSLLDLISFNPYLNYFVFTDSKNTAWYLNFKKAEEDKVEPVGYRIGSLPSIAKSIVFNPTCDLVLISFLDKVKLYKLELNSKDIYELTDLMTYSLSLPGIPSYATQWSSDGRFFTVLDQVSGHWLISSKFGCIYTNTYNITKEVTHSPSVNVDFLTASSLLIHPNSLGLYILNKSKTQIYYLNLQTLFDGDNLVFMNQNYISVVNDNKLTRLPLLPAFRHILTDLEHYNGNAANSIKNLQGELKISVNKNHQFALSYGDTLSLSTPYKTGDDINQVLWFNYKNYYMETLNIVNHMFFDKFLIVINRVIKDINEQETLVDEMIVLNIGDSKYGAGGWNYMFDSNSILWRQTFNSRILAFEVAESTSSSSKLILLESNLKILIFDLSTDTKIAASDASNEFATKDYKLFIKIVRTVHLSSIASRLQIRNVTKIKMINENHFLFLLKTGELFLLKNQTHQEPTSNSSSPLNVLKPTNFYELIKVNDAIEFFRIEYIKINSPIKYIYLFQGKKVLVYNLDKLIELSFDSSNHVSDGIEDIEQDRLIKPIVIDIECFQPLRIENFGNKSINLTVLEDLVVQSQSDNLVIRSKLSFKLILNNLIEFDIINDETPELIIAKFQQFQNFEYCIELLLFKYLTNNDETTLKKLIDLLKTIKNYELVVTNCLRKIEIVYWNKFFEHLRTTPLEFMDKIISDGNVELSYNFLIVYLNLKKENSDDDSLDTKDKEIILKIFSLLNAEAKWDWCFELCRFIKILEPSSDFLLKIKGEVEGVTA